MIRRSVASLLIISCLLSACGDTRLERTGSGAVIGAGIGGVGGALCCGDPGGAGGTGLFVGMAVGALIGFLVDHPLFFNYHDR